MIFNVGIAGVFVAGTGADVDAGLHPAKRRTIRKRAVLRRMDLFYQPVRIKLYKYIRL
jgi:hypothetical protein